MDSLEIEETVATSMESLQQYIEEPLISNMLSKMNSELDKSLTYHCYAHTLDVMKQALALAEMDDLTEHERLLLMIAAAFHDAGFFCKTKERTYRRGDGERGHVGVERVFC